MINFLQKPLKCFQLTSRTAVNITTRKQGVEWKYSTHTWIPLLLV